MTSPRDSKLQSRVAKTILLSRKNDHHVALAFEAMATLPTFELAVERMGEHGITTTPQALEGVRCFYPERFRKVWDESVAVRDAYLVDGMLDNAQLATEGEARAARRTIPNRCELARSTDTALMRE
jgi:hypothetical protein